MNVRMQRRGLFGISALVLMAGVGVTAQIATSPLPSPARSAPSSAAPVAKTGTAQPLPTQQDLVRISTRRLQRPLIDEPPEEAPMETAPVRRAPPLPAVDLIAVFGTGESSRAVLESSPMGRTSVRIGDRLQEWEVVAIEPTSIRLRSGESIEEVLLEGSR